MRLNCVSVYLLLFGTISFIFTGFCVLISTFELYPDSKVFNVTLEKQEISQFGNDFYVKNYFTFEPLPLMGCNTFNESYGPVSSVPDIEDHYEKHLTVKCKKVEINIFVVAFYVSAGICALSIVLYLLDKERFNDNLYKIIVGSSSIFIFFSSILLISTLVRYSFVKAPSNYIPVECPIEETEIILTADWKYCQSSYSFYGDTLQPHLSKCFDDYEEALDAPLDPTCYVNYYFDIFYYHREMTPLEIISVSIFPIMFFPFAIGIIYSIYRCCRNDYVEIE